MPTSRLQIAFLAARTGVTRVTAVVMLWLSALAVAMHFGMMSQMGRMVNFHECSVPCALHRVGPVRAAVVFARPSRDWLVQLAPQKSAYAKQGGAE